MSTQTAAEPTTLATHWSLVARVKNPDDRASWEEFYEFYRGLIRGVAMKQGLTEAEADDVLQETMASVAWYIREFEARPEAGMFRAWLLKIVRSRIEDQRRRRLPVRAGSAGPEGTATTATIERVPDGPSLDWAGLCEAEYRERLLAEALKELPLAVKADHYQVFHLLTMEERSVEAVARLVGRSKAQVYLIRHRVNCALRKLVKRLEKRLERGIPGGS